MYIDWNAMEMVKVFFKLKQDAEGYPPVLVESVWAKKRPDNTFEIDNIPFFTREATLGDVVSAVLEDGQLYFDSLLIEAGNSLARIIFYDEADVKPIREKLYDMGCESEVSHIPRLISVNIPPQVDFEVIRDFLLAGCDEDRWDVELAIVPGLE